jgi:hypothetical protein
LLHCSVIDSDDVQAFAQLGNAFGKAFGGQTLSFRDFGSYEMAPPPEYIWSEDATTNGDTIFPGLDMEDDDDDEDIDGFFGNGASAKQSNGGNVVMPWYSQVDAVIATFPRAGNNGACDTEIVATRKTDDVVWKSSSWLCARMQLCGLLSHPASSQISVSLFHY